MQQQKRSQANYQFNVRLSPPGWNIHLKRMDEPEISYHELGAENANETYDVMAYADNAIKKHKDELEHLKRDPEKGKHAIYFTVQGAAGRIAADTFPYAVNEPMLRFIWFSFASSDYLNILPTNQCHPYYLFETDAEYKSQAIISRMKDSYGLPNKAVIMSDGIIHSTRNANNVIKFPVPYHNSFTNMLYHVQAYTNIMGLNIPLRSKHTIYFNRPNGKNAEDIIPFYTCESNITNINNHPEELGFIPVLPENTMISDERFRKQGANQILYTNTVWPSASTINQLKEFENVQRATRIIARIQKKEHSNRVLYGISVIAMILSLPIAIMVAKKIMTKST